MLALDLNLNVAPWPFIAVAILVILSNLATFILGSWIVWRVAVQRQSPMIGIPRRIKVTGGDADPARVINPGFAKL